MIPMTPERLREIEELCDAATPTEPLTLNRYDHGGGSLFLDGESGQRKLVADFYHEGDREFYTQAYGIVPELIAAIRSLTLTWTHEVPTEAGDYWYERQAGSVLIYQVRMVYGSNKRQELYVIDFDMGNAPVGEYPGRWSDKPIPMPVEPGEEGR